MLLQQALDKAKEQLFPESNKPPITLEDIAKIDKDMYEIYSLFELNEMGRRFLKNYMMAEYLLTPELDINRLAYQEGRRSVFRQLHHIIFQINDALKRG